jgi:asparagine synthase (glutamine-hydrolysing)
MCGIAGLWTRDGRAFDPEVLRRLTDYQAHRGPDASGVWSEGPIGLGHRRLSIIDLATSSQPMRWPGRDVHLVYNGEIYNYRELRSELMARGHTFATTGDTEVLLAAYLEWGTACLQRLRGMFALAIWDGEKRELFLARDRFGIKPLCIYSAGGTLAFASEIQAFDALGAEFDDALSLPALDTYLYAGYVPAPASVFRNVHKLPPGHFCILRGADEDLRFEPYWSLAFSADPALAVGEWTEELGARIDEAVRSHLVSDVPVAAFLSGGIDSTVVVDAMARLVDEPVRAFTAGYDEIEFDERLIARRSAEILGVTHVEQQLGLDVLETLEELVAHYGEPFADSSAICTYHVTRAAAEHVKVMLSGDGGDEIFGGYSHYGWMLSEFLPTLQGSLRLRLAVTDQLRRIGLLGPRMMPVKAWIGRNSYFTTAERSALWAGGQGNLSQDTERWLGKRFARLASPGRDDLLDSVQALDANDYLPFNNLYKVDIASMCHGLEVRVPLLDHELVEFACRIPASQRVVSLSELPDRAPTAAMHGYVNKLPLRRVAEQRLGHGYFDRRKMGFAIPLDDWLASDVLRPLLEEDLLGSASPLRDHFDPAVVEGWVRAHLAGQRHGLKLYSLLFLARWLRRRKERS